MTCSDKKASDSQLYVLLTLPCSPFTLFPKYQSFWQRIWLKCYNHNTRRWHCFANASKQKQIDSQKPQAKIGLILTTETKHRTTTFGMHINTWTSQIIRTFVQTGESHTTPGVRPDVRPDVRAARVSWAAPKKKSFDRGGPVWPSRSNVTNVHLRGPPAKNWGSGGRRPPAKNILKKPENEKTRKWV